MADVVLHIGVHKTGTTALQEALDAARTSLPTHGVSYPGVTVSHLYAATSVVAGRQGWERGQRIIGIHRWERIVEEVHAAPATAVLSSEAFCEADDATARRIVDDLLPHRARIVIGLRPLDQLLPSTWQQMVKSGLATPYAEWLRTIVDWSGDEPAPVFWRRNDHARLVQRWAGIVGPERVTVIVVDPARPEHLFRSFEDVIGVPSGTLVPPPPGRDNRSLSYVEAEALRALNVRVREVVDYDAYHRLVRRGAALALLRKRIPSDDEPRVVTPRWAVEQVRAMAPPMVAAIRDTGVSVVGDLDSLMTSAPPPMSDDPAPDVSSVPIDISTELLEGMLRSAEEALAERPRRKGRAQRPQPPSGE
jgi:hypothetical protein